MFSNFNIFSVSFLIIISFIIFLVYYKKAFLEENFLKNYKHKIKPEIKFWLFAVSILLLAFAFLEPRGFGYDNTKTSSWNVVFVLDVTKSMNALDYKDEESKIVYSKLDTAKKMILDIVENNKENSYWLLVFAWEPRVMSPLTSDMTNFENLLLSSDSNSVKSNWTGISSAIKRASDMFQEDSKAKTIVLLTDWWDEEKDFSLINNIIKQENLNLITVWLWNKQWSKIPEYTDPFGQIVYKKYNGEVVVTFLNSKALKNLEGEYIEIMNYSDLQKAEKKIISENNKILSDYFLNKKKNLTRIFVMISFVLFCFYLIIDLLDKRRQDLI